MLVRVARTHLNLYLQDQANQVVWCHAHLFAHLTLPSLMLLQFRTARTALKDSDKLTRFELDVLAVVKAHHLRTTRPGCAAPP